MDLSQLSLLRNDPAHAAEILAMANKGAVDAQFAAGLIYAEGRGVPIDLIQSFFWLSKAVAQGDSDAENLRAIVGSQMSDDEYDRAQHLLSADQQGEVNKGKATLH